MWSPPLCIGKESFPSDLFSQNDSVFQSFPKPSSKGYLLVTARSTPRAESQGWFYFSWQHHAGQTHLVTTNNPECPSIVPKVWYADICLKSIVSGLVHIPSFFGIWNFEFVSGLATWLGAAGSIGSILVLERIEHVQAFVRKTSFRNVSFSCR